MSKTPLTGLMLGLLIVAMTASANGAIGDPAHQAVASPASPLRGFNDPATATDAERPAMDFNQAGSRAADLPLDAVSGEATAPLPLSQVAGGPDVTSGSGRLSLSDLINQIRYGGLPEPASWALMLIGFGMIGGALRGFMIANRRLAGLQPDESAGGNGMEDER